MDVQVWHGRGRVVKLAEPFWGTDALADFSTAIGVEPFDDPDLYARAGL